MSTESFSFFQSMDSDLNCMCHNQLKYSEVLLYLYYSAHHTDPVADSGLFSYQL